MAEKNRVITICRQFGSGGRTVGKLTAQKLGIPCYDEQFITGIAERGEFEAEYIKEFGENMSNGWVNSFLGRTSGITKQDRLWVQERTAVEELAKKGPCVIVGRCADYILRELANCLTVFIQASEEKRAERIVRVYGESPVTPRERLLFKDRSRAAYYKYYTNLEWGKRENYHITLDSGVIGIDKCAEIIADLF